MDPVEKPFKMTAPSAGRLFPMTVAEQSLWDGVVESIGDMTVGFVSVTRRDNEEVGEPAGTGTLVLIDGMRGILTASHVLAHLPRNGQVGLVRFRDKPDDFQRTFVDMRLTETFALGGASFGPSGPDVAFLRLPDDLAGSLNATNVFFNLTKRPRDELMASLDTKPYADAVAGVIAERTIVADSPIPNTIRKGLKAHLLLGNVVDDREADGLDVLDFKIEFGEPDRPPVTYGGVSGGAMWRVTFGVDFKSVHSRTLVGMAFYESDADADGRRFLTCHGPRTIYGPLIDLVRAKRAAA